MDQVDGLRLPEPSFKDVTTRPKQSWFHPSNSFYSVFLLQERGIWLAFLSTPSLSPSTPSPAGGRGEKIPSFPGRPESLTKQPGECCNVSRTPLFGADKGRNFLDSGSLLRLACVGWLLENLFIWNLEDNFRLCSRNSDRDSLSTVQPLTCFLKIPRRQAWAFLSPFLSLVSSDKAFLKT